MSLPVHFYANYNKLIIGGILVFFIGFFFVYMSLEADDAFSMGFFGFMAFMMMAIGVIIALQSGGRQPLLSLTEEGIYFRQYPGFKPLFCPWDNIWTVKTENSMAQDMIVVVVKSPLDMLHSAKGNFVQRNHARNGMRMYGSPIVINSYLLATPYFEVFKTVYEEIEKRKTVSP